MKKFVRPLLAIAVLGLASAPAFADETAIKLKPGAGVDVVETQCAACHSLDYIQMNSPFPTRAVWEAEVNKMINVFGADIPPPDAKTIVDYLAANAGS
jgi:mono/diheme cytochrome c family protein